MIRRLKYFQVEDFSFSGGGGGYMGQESGSKGGGKPGGLPYTSDARRLV